ncbi:HAD family hydrolase [Photobacterium minamisatsumaniensis]|uniref:HAD family hydrolase n=1 Tax=Photobacterium minamisatsumaniensis TaxID=2910233 RepID=UPI003D0E8F88
MRKKTIIFDMDGVIIDSEPLWQQAQDESLSVYGIHVTPEECERYTMGKRVDAIANTWCELYQLKINSEVLEESILRNLYGLILREGKANPGLYELLDFLEGRGYQIGLATSSNRIVIEAVFDKLRLWDYFKVICSAEDEKLGKPSPDVYITAAKKLGVEPNKCLVIEDSLNGLIAAKAALMETYLVSPQCENQKFNMADKNFTNLYGVFGELSCIDYEIV